MAQTLLQNADIVLTLKHKSREEVSTHQAQTNTQGSGIQEADIANFFVESILLAT